MNWKMVRSAGDGTLSGAEAGGTKVYGTETHIEVQRLLLGVLGAAGRVRPESLVLCCPDRSSSSPGRAS